MYKIDVWSNLDETLVLSKSCKDVLELNHVLSCAFILFGFPNYHYSIYYDEQKG